MFSLYTAAKHLKLIKLNSTKGTMTALRIQGIETVARFLRCQFIDRPHVNQRPTCPDKQHNRSEGQSDTPIKPLRWI
jgi:hypothetical protein